MKKLAYLLTSLLLALCLCATGAVAFAAENDVTVTKTIRYDNFENWLFDNTTKSDFDYLYGGYGWNDDKVLRAAKIDDNYELVDAQTYEGTTNAVIVASGSGVHACGTGLTAAQYSRNYQITIDVMFRNQTSGVVTYYLKGLCNAVPGGDDWVLFEFQKGKPDEEGGAVYNNLKLFVGGQLAASNADETALVKTIADGDEALGNIGFDTWIKLTFRKNGPNIEGLINGVKIFSKELEVAGAPTLTNFNTNTDTDGGLIYIDNVTAEDIEPTVAQDIPVTSVTVSMPRIQINTGDTINIRAIKTPYDATEEEFEWYINGVKQTETGATLSYTGTKAGTYEFVCKIGGKESAKKTLTVVEKAPENNNNGNNTTIIIVCVVAGVLVIGAFAALTAVLIKHKPNKTDKSDGQSGDDGKE